MMNVLIAYDTTEGQTRKIAGSMGDAMGGSGHDARVIDIRRLPSGFVLDGFVKEFLALLDQHRATGRT